MYKHVWTGGGIENADVELFFRLRTLFVTKSNASVFIVGNAFGYSSIVLSYLFKEGTVDAIDAETEGDCNALGSYISRKVAETAGLNFRLTVGFSPDDVPKAFTPGIKYDIAFVDGEHTNEQVVADFFAIEPRLALRSVVILHDVGYKALHKGVAALPTEWKRHVVKGQFYKNLVGTVLLHRGYPRSFFDGL
jgi:predicted O-methyltransferase YrrM